jgi:hypothetical protein
VFTCLTGLTGSPKLTFAGFRIGRIADNRGCEMRCILLCAVLVGMCPVSASGGELQSVHAAADFDRAVNVGASSSWNLGLQSAQPRQGSMPKEISEIHAEGAG